MQPRILPARLITFTAFTLAAMCCFVCVAHALDWRIIQDELGAQLNAGGEAFRGYQFNVPANEMHRRGKLLFAKDFEDSISANDPENSGITLVSDADTEGTCFTVIAVWLSHKRSVGDTRTLDHGQLESTYGFRIATEASWLRRGELSG